MRLIALGLLLLASPVYAQTQVYCFGGTDTTFTDGDTETSWQPHNFAYGCRITFAEAGTVNRLGFYGRTETGTPTLKIALYNTSGGLVASSSMTITSSTPTWADSSTFAPVAVSAADYFILYSAQTTEVRIGYDSANNGSVTNEPFATFPENPANPSIQAEVETGFGYSGRAQFTAGGGGGSAVPKIMQQLTANDDEYERPLVANRR